MTELLPDENRVKITIFDVCYPIKTTAINPPLKHQIPPARLNCAHDLL